MNVYAKGFSDIGLARKVNQDSICIYQKGEISVYCVADGMGGHQDGELASRCITERVASWCADFEKQSYHGDFYTITMSLTECLEKASEYIFHEYNRDQICGSTVVLLYLYQGNYGCLWLGDSRIYLNEKFRFSQITVDDVWENQIENVQNLSKEAVINSPKRGKLLTAMGIQPKVVMHIKTGELKKHMVFFLCSDGIYKTCSIQKIKQSCKLTGTMRAEEALDMLKSEAYQAGARDNLSAIIVSIG